MHRVERSCFRQKSNPGLGFALASGFPSLSPVDWLNFSEARILVQCPVIKATLQLLSSKLFTRSILLYVLLAPPWP